MSVPRVPILGVPFSACAYADVLAWLGQKPSAAASVVVANVADVMTARRDLAYRKALESGDWVVPDGMPIVWALREEGFPLPDRVYGPDLMRLILDDASLAARRHVLVGASAPARAGVRARFPGVHWVGEADPDFAQLEAHPVGEDRIDAAGCFIPGSWEGLAAWLNRREAEVIWISLGGGRQVMAMAKLKPMLRAGVMLGVGAAFDFHAGLLPQAPRWMQRRGLESVFRFCQEPRRLWHRYLVLNPPFFWHRWWERRRRQRLE